ncbi:MAG: CotH kinase family protein [Acidobacteria bacterium]|nr:CotH kinase family protein [Acidobacteriota bacterium]
MVHEIRLSIHASDWQKLRDTYLEDTYYAAILEWGGLTIEDTAVRSRGDGSRNGNKPGLKVDFDHFAAGREFLGLKALVLDNLTQDQSMMTERLSMAMFRRMGLPAPRVAHARLYVNGAYAGLYTIVEPVDKNFLKRTLGEDGGYLYDYEWGGEYWFEYPSSDPAAYSPYPFQPQTNEKPPDPRVLEQMIRAINESPDAEFIRNVSGYLDLKQFLDYLAIETYIGEMDGVLGDWGLNNFYLYQFQGTNAFMLIPWDKDVTFRDAGRPVWQNSERNVLTRRLLRVPDIREQYLQALERAAALAEGPGGWLEQEIDRIYKQIQTAALEDPNKPFSYSEFEEGASNLRYFSFARPNVVVGEITAARAGAFESAP